MQWIEAGRAKTLNFSKRCLAHTLLIRCIKEPCLLYLQFLLPGTSPKKIYGGRNLKAPPLPPPLPLVTTNQRYCPLSYLYFCLRVTDEQSRGAYCIFFLIRKDNRCNCFVWFFFSFSPPEMLIEKNRSLILPWTKGDRLGSCRMSYQESTITKCLCWGFKVFQVR